MTHFFIFLWISFLVTFTPGPSILFAVSQGMSRGFWRAIPGLLGNLTASIGYGLLSACSVGYFLRSNPAYLNGIALVGSTYLIITGLLFIFKKNTKSSLAQLSVDTLSNRSTAIKDFFDGFIVNLSNPKIILFYLIVIPQFSANSDTVILSLITLALIQNAMKAGSLVFYSALAYQVRNWFKAISDKTIQRFSGVIIVIAGLILMIDNAKF